MLSTVLSLSERLFTTAGCHPTRCSEFDPDPEEYYARLQALIKQNKGKIVAVGECGLDYDRLEFCLEGFFLHYYIRLFIIFIFL